MELLNAKVKFEGRHYRNVRLAEYIGCFVNKAQQDAAWATVRFIRETWPETEDTLRGELLGIEEGEA